MSVVSDPAFGAAMRLNDLVKSLDVDDGLALLVVDRNSALGIASDKIARLTVDLKRSEVARAGICEIAKARLADIDRLTGQLADARGEIEAKALFIDDLTESIAAERARSGQLSAHAAERIDRINFLRAELEAERAKGGRFERVINRLFARLGRGSKARQ